jgi:hypothetical protein
MAKKIGHNYSRDPYPWDEAKGQASSASWTCCDMNLPATFYLCPICDKERSADLVEVDTYLSTLFSPH